MMRLRALGALILLAGASCSPYPGAQISKTPGGELFVEVQEAQSFNALARFLYGDARLGPSVARLAELPYEEGVPAGLALTLPPKSVIEEHAKQEGQFDSLLEKGNAALESGKFSDAIETLSKARRIHPDRPDVLLLLGIAHLRVRELDDATPLLERAAKLSPDDPDAHLALATLYRKREHPHRALAELEAARETLGEGSSNARLSFDYALTLKELGYSAKARKAFQVFLYEFPSNPWVDAAERHLAELENLVEP